MDKKTQIMNAAMALLTQNGMQATPMSAIAKAAGTGMGTIYNYFATKEELINAIYLFIKDKQVRKIMESFPDASVKKQFDYFYEALMRYLLTHPQHFHFMDQFGSSPVLTDATRAEGLRAFEPMLEMLRKGRQEGILKQFGIDELMQFINGGLFGFVRWQLSQHKTAPDETLLQHQLRIAWDAIKQ